MLEALGITDVEESTYLSLLDHPAEGVPALARRVGVSVSKTREALENLEAKGLLTRVPGKPLRFLPAPPEIAIQSLVMKREEELARARGAAPELAKRFRDSAGAAGEEPVQVVTGRDAIVRTYLQLERGAVEEFVAFDKPPYAGSTVVCNPVELECLARGVRYRVVYDEQALEMPGQIETLETVMGAGERARVMPGVPMKLVIVDGKVGLIPVGSGESGIEAALLVQPSALLDALKRLFEELWAQAQPIPLQGTGAPPPAPPVLSEDDARVVALLATGMQDEAIARQLGRSRRTVERRIARMMEALGARTRFQAALRARERGWL